jgi:hypothetical protein
LVLVATQDGTYIYSKKEGDHILVDLQNIIATSFLYKVTSGAVYGYVIDGDTCIAIFGQNSTFDGYYNKSKKIYITDATDYSKTYSVYYYNGTLANSDTHWQTIQPCFNPQKNYDYQNLNKDGYKAGGYFQKDPVAYISQTCIEMPESRELSNASYARIMNSPREAIYKDGVFYFRYEFSDDHYEFMAVKYDETQNKNFYYLWIDGGWKHFTPPNFSDAPFTNILLCCKYSGHNILDILGTIDITGLTDIINGIWYYAEGDKFNGTLSLIAALPIVFADELKSLKYISKAAKEVELSEEALSYCKIIYENAGDYASNLEKICVSIEKNEVLNSVLKKISELEKTEIPTFLADLSKGNLASNLSKFDENIIDIWKTLNTNKSKYVKTNFAYIEKYSNLTTVVQSKIAKFTDEASGSTLTKFLDDCDDANLKTAFDGNEQLVESWKVLNDAGVDNSIRTNTDKLSKVEKYLNNNPTRKDVFLDRLKKTSDSNEFIDRTSWKDDIVQQYGDDINQFKPQGLSKTDVPQSTYDDMLNASNAPSDIKEGIIDDLIRSGSTPPVKTNLKDGDKLYKITPKGEGVSDFSPFWITKSELDNLRGAGGLEQKLGLPINSHAVEYDVLEITATKDVDVFTSTIAPTVQNGYKTIGGATQTLVLDRSAWSEATTIEIFIP